MKALYEKIVDWLFSRNFDKPLSNFFKNILLFGLFIIGAYVVLGIAAFPATILWLLIFYGGEYIYNLFPKYITDNSFFSIEVGLFSGLIVFWCIFLLFCIFIILRDFLIKKKKFSLSEIFFGFSEGIFFFAKIFLSLNAILLFGIGIFFFFLGFFGIGF